MFFFTYKNEILKASSIIEIKPLEFLLYVDDKNLILNSNQLSIADYKSLLSFCSDLDEDQITMEDYSYLDFCNCKIDKLSFMELLNIYRAIYKNSSTKAESFRQKLVESLKNLVYNYTNKGLKTDLKSFKEIVRRALETDILCEDYGIEPILKEYILFLKIKAYESMNLYELLSERDRFYDVMFGKTDIKDLGFPEVDYDTLIDRVMPALKILIHLKEDIYLLELFNIYRDYELQNPFIINKEQYNKRRRGDFSFSENALLLFNYEYFENLGISTNFFVDDINELYPWQFSYISDYLYSLVEKVINKVKEEDAFTYKLKTVERNHGNSPFIKFFLDYVKGIIKI